MAKADMNINVTLKLDKELEDVRQFHEKMGFLTFTQPGHLTRRKLRERIDCLSEELNEFILACEIQDLSAQADALIDLVYFAKGTALMLGLPWVEMWDEVQSKNMQKERGQKIRGGSLHKVDAVKPVGWQPPDFTKILTRHGYHPSLCRQECQRDDSEETQTPLTPTSIPEKTATERFWELCEECVAKADKLAGPTNKENKSSDYNDGGISIVDYALSGATDPSTGFFPDVWKKVLRLKSLFSKARLRPAEAVRNEPIEDNLVDLLNYVRFEYAMYMLSKEAAAHENDRG